MSFSFNNSVGNNYTNSYSGTEAIAPENTGISWIAQTRTNNIVGRYAQRLINALRVDGAPITLWQKTQTGFPCTCCKPDGTSTGLLASAIQNESNTNSFYTEPNSTSLPDATERTFKTIRMRGVDFTEADQEGVWADLVNPSNKDITPEISETFTLNKVLINENQNQDNDIIIPDSSELMGQQDFGDVELDSFFAGGDSGAVFGGDKTACGICFTSGWTQGYSLVNGKRYILDASGEIPFSMQGADLISSTYPHSFELPINSGWVHWKLELPVFCLQWVNIRVRNNLKPAKNVVLEYADSTVLPLVWSPLSLDVLNSTSNDATRIWLIRARRNPNSINYPSCAFTHIELMLVQSEPIPAQTPNFTYNTDFNQYDAIVNTTFEVAPSVVMIPRESVFTDNKYGLLWKVINTTPRMTSGQQIFCYEVDARVVQRHEMLYKLHELYVDVPNYLAVVGASGQSLQDYNSTNVQQINEIASTLENYQTLQQVQGGYAPVNFQEQSFGQQVDGIVPDDTQPLVMTSVQVPTVMLPLESNTGMFLTEGLQGQIIDEYDNPQPIVIVNYPSYAVVNVPFILNGTFWPYNATVQVGISTDVAVPPLSWQAVTSTYPNWSSSIVITSTGSIFLWARSISSNIYTTIVGPISVS